MNYRTNPKETLYYKLPTVLVDTVVHLAAFYSILFIEASQSWEYHGMFWKQGMPVLLLIAYAISVYIIGIRLNDRMISNFIVILRALSQVLCTMVLFIFLVSIVYGEIPYRLYICQYISASVLITMSHFVIRLVINWIRKSGHNKIRVVMLGADDNLVSIWKEMKTGFGLHGYSVAGFFTDKYTDQVPEEAEVLGNVSDIIEYLQTHEVDEIYCGINPAADRDLVYRVIHEAESRFMQFWFVPNMNGYPHRRMHYDEFGSVNVICLREEPLNNPAMKILKRSSDILLSGLFLVTLFPFVWLFAAAGIKLSSPGPVFFRQKRTGYNGKAFDCLKFRSMKVNTDSDRLQATENDPRKTKFGDFLRRTSIDELPQLINVFKGDMSLIGPRPHMEFHTEMYSKLISEYMVRHLVKPGLTGWAQVNGCRGETRTVEQMKERVEHDIWYIEHWSPVLDIKIIFMTVAQILMGDRQAY